MYNKSGYKNSKFNNNYSNNYNSGYNNDGFGSILKKIGINFLIIIAIGLMLWILSVKFAKAETLDDTDLYLIRDKIVDTIDYSDTEKLIIYDTDNNVEDNQYIRKDGKVIYEDKSKRTQTTQAFGNYLKSYSSPQFIYKDTEWYYLEYATSTKEDFEEAQKDIKLISLLNPLKIFPTIAQDTFYSGSGDGSVRFLGTDGTWSTPHDSTTGNLLDYTSATSDIQIYRYSDGDYIIRRTFLPFDTSALPDDAIIGTSTLYIYVTQITDYDSLDISLVQTSQASPNELVNDDYDNIGTTRGATDKALSTFSTSAYNTMSLNSTGQSWISVDGWTYLGLRFANDLEDDTSDWSGDVPPASTRSNELKWQTSDYTGTSQDPYLLVEYSTSTPEATSTETVYATSSLPCEFNYSNDLTMITGCTEIYTSSTTPAETRYHYYQIPFIAFIIIIIPFIWVANRLLIEFIKRWNKN